MSEETMTFTLAALRDMNFDVDDATPDTLLGPSGVDLDSLAVAELALRIEDAFQVKFGEEDMESLAIMTLGEFADEVAKRAPVASAESAAP